MKRVKENDIKVDKFTLLCSVYRDACCECHEFFFSLRDNIELPVFEFSESVFDDLMGVVAFEIMKYDWKCASREVKFSVTYVAESAAKIASDVTVVANFFVSVFVKC